MERFKNFASRVAESASTWAEKAADSIGELTDAKLHESGPQYCSWCFEQHTCTPVEANNLSRNVYACDGCGNHVVKCRACDNYAKLREITASSAEESPDENDSTWGWESQFCAVHAGSIANFEHLNDQLSCVSQYEQVFERSGTNFKKIGTATAGVTGGAAIVAPLAFIAAPAAGAAIGSSFYGLSGAAATSKGLAVLGGGSVAASGFGMAGGVAVVTATGSALGGRHGAVIANGYFGDVDGFEIEPLHEAGDPTVLCINGFLTEGDESASAHWLKALIGTYHNNSIMHVKWESKRLMELAESIGQFSGSSGGWSAMAIAGKKGLRTAAKKATPVGAALSGLGIASNPWSIARVKAAETGALLADLIARTDRRYILVGHSLGARVIYFCLRALAEKEGSYIDEAHLLGGAVDSFASLPKERMLEAEYAEEAEADEAVDWTIAATAVRKGINNYYSEKDGVLQTAYSATQGFRGNPVGRNPIDHYMIQNLNVTKSVEGHSEYIPNLKAFFEPVRTDALHEASAGKIVS